MEAGASCGELEVDHLTASPNNTEYPHDTYVYVNCASGYTFSGNHLILCDNGSWDPSLPECILKKTGGSSNVLIITVCTVASLVALIIIVLAAYMVSRNWRQERSRKNKQEACKKKIMSLSMDHFATSQDCVGMPPVVFDNINSVMRGRTVSSSLSSATTCTSPETSQDGEASTSSDKVFIY